MATVQCNSLHLTKPHHTRRPFHSVFSSTRLSSTLTTSISCPSSSAFKTSTSTSSYRWGGTLSALVSEGNAIGSSFSAADEVFKLTYLEGNSWLWNVGGANILVDPVLVGNLDFGIPWLYDAARKVLKKFQLSDLPEIDCLLITQSLDDHCHLKTLKPLSQKSPNIRVIATPNAKNLLDPLFRNNP